MDIIKAIKNGKLSEIDNYIKRSDNLNAQDEDGRSPLMLVAHSFSRSDLVPEVLDRYEEAMFLLLSNGAEAMLADNNNYTVFSYITSEHSKAFKMIKASGAADSFLCGVDPIAFDHEYDDLFVARICYGLKDCSREARYNFRAFLERNNWGLSEDLKNEIELSLITIEADLAIVLSGAVIES